MSNNTAILSWFQVVHSGLPHVLNSKECNENDAITHQVNSSKPVNW